MTLRVAHPLDASKIGGILFQFERTTDWMPKQHSHAEMIGYGDRLIARGWVQVVERKGAVVGFVARDGAEVCALYVDQDWRGYGIGTELLQDAQARQKRLWLRTPQRNEAARRFYERFGFYEFRRTDGQGTDEGMPDAYLQWQAPSLTEKEVREHELQASCI